jgi:hypothetical protein
MDSSAAFDAVNPTMIRRSNGEWLAISPRNARFSIGVTAETEGQASLKFRSVYKLWIALLSEKT